MGAMRTLGDIMSEPALRSGVNAVLAAADAARDKLSDAQYLASFAPPPILYAQCVCGSVFEVRATEVTAEDRDALADWHLAHDYCGGDY